MSYTVEYLDGKKLEDGWVKICHRVCKRAASHLPCRRAAQRMKTDLERRWGRAGYIYRIAEVSGE